MNSSIFRSIEYKRATQGDAHVIAKLLTELSHPNSELDIRARWDEWSGFPGNEVWLANLKNEVIGLAILGKSPSLYRPFPIGRLWALVVSENHRNLGVGREFLSLIEDMFSRTDCGMIELTSNVIREDAHRFYLQLGYEKSSYRFAKKLL